MRGRMWPIARRNRAGVFPGVSTGGSTPVNPPEEGIYMSLAGSDTEGDGSINSPYRSLAKAGAEAEAVAALGTATTIYLRGGYYDVNGTDAYLTPNSGMGPRVKFSGTSTAPITVRSYPGEWAVFDGLNHPDWPMVEDLERPDGQEPSVIQFVGSWVNWEYLEFRNSVGRGMHMYSMDCKYRYMVFQNCHASGYTLYGSRNEVAYCLTQDNYSISNGGNTGNGMVLMYSASLRHSDRFPGETGTRDNRIHHCVAWNCSDDGFNYVPASGDGRNVFEYNVSTYHGYGWAGAGGGNGQGFKMGLGGSDTGTICRFNLAFGNTTAGVSNNGSSGVLFHNNTAWDSGGVHFSLAASGVGDNEAYNNLSLYPGPSHRQRETGVTVHTHNAGYPGVWDILGGEGNFDTQDVDPQVVSYDWTSADFLRLGPTSPYLSNGKVITGGSTTLGAIPDGEDFAGGWDWRTLVNAYPSHGLRERATMSPIAQGTRTPYPGT